ncbi:lipase chaperone [Psychrobacter sp. DAB_AL43B]|uniref:lipase chaperone n=1 Tax=Psychrobacter sp. DAB_AL43B TaxID=1028416 RepID=UPI0009A62C79|nr:lipase chaperone [Psychrobacter sp. DAB_AL43B]
MSKRLTNIVIIAAASMWALTGCDNSTDTANKNSDAAVTTADAAAANTVDWSAMASGEQAADLANYQYPFALDSQNVRDYAEYFKVDNATAQHNLTVSMASNEALSKALDQLSESYVSHQLTDDKDMTLIIHTTPDVAASSYNYVLAGDFAKGLVLPIEIKPDGKKGEVKGHANN